MRNSSHILGTSVGYTLTSRPDPSCPILHAYAAEATVDKIKLEEIKSQNLECGYFGSCRALMHQSSLLYVARRLGSVQKGL